MAKKKSGIVKAAVGIGAVVVAGKVAYEKPLYKGRTG